MASHSDGRYILPGGHVLTYLPAIGGRHRNPDFWPDADVTRLVVLHHRQMMICQLLDLIRTEVGEARTPSKSAVCRAWQRLDIAVKESRLKPVQRVGR